MKRSGIAFILVLTLSLVALVAGGHLPAGDAMIRLPTQGVSEEEERPWKCCDLSLCTFGIDPRCRCIDVVEQCAGACKDCVGVPFGHVCNDWYTGEPGPRCDGW